ncbi:MAG TPA: acyl-CoA dehydrogenase family protein [Thermodesulfobacteriota bacterium]|nr:acyl-CoA dehydrogenase family protein [Thermodesulfobacteriota bacterium]
MGIRELNVDLTEEHIALRDAARKFLEGVWRPASIALDKLSDPQEVIAHNSILWDVFRRTQELGYHKMPFPKAVGGLELDILSMSLISEEMGWAAPDLAVSLAVSVTPFAYAQLSPESEVRDLTRKFCEDTDARMIGCWAITEPDHGSDWILLDVEEGKNPKIVPQVRAVPDGDHYLINGQKSSWVSNGSIATHAALWVSLNPSIGMEGGGIAVVPLNLPGVFRGKPLNKLGQRALNQGEIFFDNVRVPKSMMIAQEPMGFKFMSHAQLALANGLMGLCFAGTAQAALEEAIKYARTRVQGGQPICKHQAVKLKLFDMFVSVEAARSLARRVAVYNGGLLKKLQLPAVHYAMAAKVLSTETAFRVASEAIQVYGGYGLCKDYYVEKIFRDTRAAMIEDGTNEVLSLGGADRLMSAKVRGEV